MTIALRILSLAVVCAVIGVLIRERAGMMAVLLSLAACTVLLLTTLRFLSPVLDFADRLRSLSSLHASLLNPLLKITAMGILTQVAGSLCEDSGDRALGKTVNICGAIFSVYISLPLFQAVLDTIESLLGG